MSTYMFPHSWPQEEKRLALMSAMLDPHTLFRIGQLGLAKGWRCLEIGAGNGSAARALSRQVGDKGHVVAIDLATDLIEANAPPNLEVRRLDVVEAVLEKGLYDLVYTRALLHHLPQYGGVLAKLTAALKLGGVILIQEPDMHPADALYAGDWRNFWLGFRNWSMERGVDHQMGRKIGPLLRGLGFENVQGYAESIYFAGGSGAAEFYKLSIMKNRDEFTGSGHVSADLFDRFLKLLDDPGHWGMCISFVATSGRKSTAERGQDTANEVQ